MRISASDRTEAATIHAGQPCARPTPPANCSFVLSVERGKLESQAVLLVESLRRYGGAYAACPVYAVSPRPSWQVGAACRGALSALGAQLVVEELLPKQEAYGSVARLAACAWAERHLPCEVLVSLDDNLFFAGEPDFGMPNCDFFARPVDVKGICTAGPGDRFDAYWRKIAQICEVGYEEIPWLATTVDRTVVKASFNGGMVAVRRELGLFQRAEQFWQVLRMHSLAPRKYGWRQIFASTGYVGPEATRWWGSAQVVLSLAATYARAAIAIAPPTYNVPAHLLH